ncbi:pilus assembly protein TadG-related protein [Planctomyces sp. SH-PL14]|uniref:pilus assembly protein TadG-related protein n=1 Tax=Planctomyces sp. SH-PL14 TaxID=1632864 RepID=UPI00078C48C2|nr:pilus assembly protein TadG-related protein [Planctomyces sp. SH-PL14]AMV21065.1 von Willebrand factor type A domain protein [Planctomyces sp. SH-PL14]
MHAVTSQYSRQPVGSGRRGSFMVLGVVCLVAMMAFVAFSVDLGYISVTRSQMQNGVDAAALAAALEITNAVQNAGPDVQDVTAYAMQQARLKAAEIAGLNGIYVDPQQDVEFGLRTQNAQTKAYSVSWGSTPANTVRVHARRTEDDTSAPDGLLPLFFAPVFGRDTQQLQTSATAYVEARDIVAVLDYSGSMNDDSTYTSLSLRSQSAIETNMQNIWSALIAVRNYGTLPFTPAWAGYTVTSNSQSGTGEFRNTQFVVSNLTRAMNQVTLTYSDNTTSTLTASGTSGTFTRSGTAKTITAANVRIQYTTNGDPDSGSGSSSSRTATVTFNHPNYRVVTNTNITQIVLNYYGGGSSTTNVSGSVKDRTVSGNGTYVSSVTVKMGSYTVTVANPNGSSPPTTTVNLAFTSNAAAKAKFGWNSVSWPYAAGSWDGFITFCQTDSYINTAGYRHKYGGMCLVDYLMRTYPSYSQCNDLWRTPHYPFHSVKQGAQLLATFVEDLGFGDELGLVCYADTAVDEHTLNYDGYNINLSSNPICDKFADLRQIVGHRQAAHYTNNTNIGDGIARGKLMLDNSKRPGTRPTIVLMTDGLANRNGTLQMPNGWNWNTLFDYDNNGTADYTTTNTAAQYALVKAKEAVDAGYTIHCMSVGLGADQDLMSAIAWLGRGIYIHVPGDQSVAEMEADVLAAFNRIAAFVPPAKLVKE